MLSEKEIVDAVKEMPEEDKKSLSEKLAEEFYLDVKNKGVLDAINNTPGVTFDLLKIKKKLGSKINGGLAMGQTSISAVIKTRTSLCCAH